MALLGLYWGNARQRMARITNSGYKCRRWAELMEYYILHRSGERWEQQQAYSAFQFWTESVPVSQNLKRVITYFLGIFKKHLSLKVPAWKRNLLISARFSLLLCDMGSWLMGRKLEGSWRLSCYFSTSLQVGWFPSWHCGGEESPDWCRLSGHAPMESGSCCPPCQALTCHMNKKV